MKNKCNWRPPNWNEYRSKFADFIDGDYELTAAALEDFELGADAILEALRFQRIQDKEIRNEITKEILGTNTYDEGYLKGFEDGSKRSRNTTRQK